MTPATTVVKLLSKPEIMEEALTTLGVSSPLHLPPQCLSLAVVADDSFDLTPVRCHHHMKETYVYYGSIEEWRTLFLSNPPIDLDPFFHVLSRPLRIKKEHDVWKSK